MKPLSMHKILTLSGNILPGRGLQVTGGMSLRKLTVSMLCVAAVITTGCASRDPTLARVEGSEPQRLSFGKPAMVKASFADKMQTCWFSGTYPLLGGYQYDSRPGLTEVADSGAQMEQITISYGKGDSTQIFVVQFNPYNENTLISTRNVSFPPELAAKMKRDVETWIFGRGDCGGSPASPMPAVDRQPGGTQASQQTARLQPGSTPDVPDSTVAASVVSPSRVTLSKGN